jgi:replicative DNA helicase
MYKSGDIVTGIYEACMTPTLTLRNALRPLRMTSREYERLSRKIGSIVNEKSMMLTDKIAMILKEVPAKHYSADDAKNIVRYKILCENEVCFLHDIKDKIDE